MILDETRNIVNNLYTDKKLKEKYFDKLCSYYQSCIVLEKYISLREFEEELELIPTIEDYWKDFGKIPLLSDKKIMSLSLEVFLNFLKDGTSMRKKISLMEKNEMITFIKENITFFDERLNIINYVLTTDEMIFSEMRKNINATSYYLVFDTVDYIKAYFSSNKVSEKYALFEKALECIFKIYFNLNIKPREELDKETKRRIGVLDKTLYGDKGHINEMKEILDLSFSSEEDFKKLKKIVKSYISFSESEDQELKSFLKRKTPTVKEAKSICSKLLEIYKEGLLNIIILKHDIKSTNDNYSAREIYNDVVNEFNLALQQLE